MEFFWGYGVKMKKYILMGLILLTILFIGCVQEKAPTIQEQIIEIETPVVDEQETTEALIIEEIVELPIKEEILIDFITIEELSKHDSFNDCWIGYEGQVYDLTDAMRHPSMGKTFWGHCGDPESFEQAAKSRHSTSNADRVENYADYVGELE